MSLILAPKFFCTQTPYQNTGQALHQNKVCYSVKAHMCRHSH